MSSSSSSVPYPRRRAADSNTSPPHLDTTQCLTGTSVTSLKKGATFHSPSSSTPGGPALDVHHIPRRAPTSPEQLQELVNAAQERINDLIDSFDKSFDGLTSSKDLDDTKALPVPGFFVAHAAKSSPPLNKEHMDSSKKQASPEARQKAALRSAAAAAANNQHQHASDSGLGSSITSDNQDPNGRARLRSSRSPAQAGTLPSRLTDIPEDVSGRMSSSSVYSESHSAINKSYSSATARAEGHALSQHATEQIKKRILEPILKEPRLKNYHPFVKDLPDRIGDRSITCLRDLEKTLIFLAPLRSKSAVSYLQFCETSIQYICQTYRDLSEQDQRRPTDRPYTNHYFVDLVQQIRQYAQIMAASRQKQAEGKPLGEMDYVPGERLRIHGGMSKNGKPAELVREKDGKMIPIESDKVAVDYEDDDMDDDIERSMARKRKCDIGKEVWHACRECGKEFKRPCDLTKHEKTHSRPWKCSDPSCKYHDLGWPTEKERDRHVNDKHSDAPPMFRCLYSPCTYSSKRESNCKQHMEKAHGWEYVRSKNNKKGPSLIPTSSTTRGTPQSNFMPTPSSGTAFPNLSTPGTPFIDSPLDTASVSDVSMDRNMMPMNPPALPGHTGHFMTSMDFDENTDGFGFTDFGFGLSPISPEGQDNHTGSYGTPDARFDTIDANLPSSAFEGEFNFGDMNMNAPWPQAQDFFSQYNLQQPTPAWSDQMDFNDGQNNKLKQQQQQQAPPMGQLTPDADADPLYADDGYGVTQDKPAGDFALFGNETVQNAGESSSMGALFPDIGTVGQQFSDPMFDSMETGATQEYTNFDNIFSREGSA